MISCTTPPIWSELRVTSPLPYRELYGPRSRETSRGYRKRESPERPMIPNPQDVFTRARWDITPETRPWHAPQSFSDYSEDLAQIIWLMTTAA
jgi:hypothetical protein